MQKNLSSSLFLVCVCVFSVLERFHGLEQIFTGVLVPEKGKSHFSKVLHFLLSLIFWLCSQFGFLLLLLFSHYFQLNSLTLNFLYLLLKSTLSGARLLCKVVKMVIVASYIGDSKELHGLNKRIVFIKIFYAYAIWSNKHLSLYKWKRVKRWHRKLVCICDHYSALKQPLSIGSLS